MNYRSPKPIPAAFTLVSVNADVYPAFLALDSSQAKPFTLRPGITIPARAASAFRRHLTPNSKLFPQATALIFHIPNMLPRI